MSDTELLLEWSRPSASPAAQSSSSTPGATKAPLTAAEKAEAKKNPEFQAFLMGKGYTAEDWK